MSSDKPYGKIISEIILSLSREEQKKRNAKCSDRKKDWSLKLCLSETKTVQMCTHISYSKQVKPIIC